MEPFEERFLFIRNDVSWQHMFIFYERSEYGSSNQNFEWIFDDIVDIEMASLPCDFYHETPC